MPPLRHELQMTRYFSALHLSFLPVRLQRRRAQLLLEQLPFLNRVAHWYGRKGIDIPPEYAICSCHLQQPEAWDHFTRPHAGRRPPWKVETSGTRRPVGLATPPANEIQRLMQKPDIKGAV